MQFDLLGLSEDSGVYPFDTKFPPILIRPGLTVAPYVPHPGACRDVVLTGAYEALAALKVPFRMWYGLTKPNYFHVRIDWAAKYVDLAKFRGTVVGALVSAYGLDRQLTVISYSESTHVGCHAGPTFAVTYGALAPLEPLEEGVVLCGPGAGAGTARALTCASAAEGTVLVRLADLTLLKLNEVLAAGYGVYVPDYEGDAASLREYLKQQ